MVKTLPSSMRYVCWGAGVQSLVGELGLHMPLGQKNQNISNRSNIVTNSIKTLEMVHIKKKNLKKSGIFHFSSGSRKHVICGWVGGMDQRAGDNDH